MRIYENKLPADFLLGRLTEEERGKFEESFVTDKSIYDELVQTETDLIDDFVAGRMTEDDRLRFETLLASNPRQRQKVIFSRALFRYSSERQAASLEVNGAGVFDRLASIFSLRYAFAVPAAAAVVILTFGIMLIVRNDQAPPIARTIENTNETAPIVENEQLPDIASAVNTGEGDRQRPVRDERSDSKRRPVNGQPSTRSTLAVVSTIILRPGISRGAGETQSSADSKAGGLVRLQIETASIAGEFRSYSVIVETVSGERIWSRKVRASSGSILADVPARLLPKGDYIVTLKGISATGLSETVEEYTFTIR